MLLSKSQSLSGSQSPRANDYDYDNDNDYECSHLKEASRVGPLLQVRSGFGRSRDANRFRVRGRSEPVGADAAGSPWRGTKTGAGGHLKEAAYVLCREIRRPFVGSGGGRSSSLRTMLHPAIQPPPLQIAIAIGIAPHSRLRLRQRLRHASRNPPLASRIPLSGLRFPVSALKLQLPPHPATRITHHEPRSPPLRREGKA